MDLSQKTVLVTGASKGIGKATALAFAAAGCSVAIAYKSDTAAAQIVLEECNRLSAGNILVKGDASVPAEVARLVGDVKNAFSQVDVLVNNAGIFDEEDAPMNIEAFERVYRNNFLSAVLMVKAVRPLMTEGKIINVSSIHGRLGHGRPSSIAYAAFKAALESYTKNLAKELAPRILVNAIAPGRVLTGMWGEPDAAEQKEIGSAQLIGRMIRPEEIADGILFLVKNDALCGEILTMDGGMGLVTLG